MNAGLSLAMWSFISTVNNAPKAWTEEATMDVALDCLRRDLKRRGLAIVRREPTNAAKAAILGLRASTTLRATQAARGGSLWLAALEQQEVQP